MRREDGTCPSTSQVRRRRHYGNGMKAPGWRRWRAGTGVDDVCHFEVGLSSRAHRWLAPDLSCGPVISHHAQPLQHGRSFTRLRGRRRHATKCRPRVECVRRRSDVFFSHGVNERGPGTGTTRESATFCNTNSNCEKYVETASNKLY